MISFSIIMIIRIIFSIINDYQNNHWESLGITRNHQESLGITRNHRHSGHLSDENSRRGVEHVLYQLGMFLSWWLGQDLLSPQPLSKNACGKSGTRCIAQCLFRGVQLDDQTKYVQATLFATSRRCRNSCRARLPHTHIHRFAVVYFFAWFSLIFKCWMGNTNT